VHAPGGLISRSGYLDGTSFFEVLFTDAKIPDGHVIGHNIRPTRSTADRTAASAPHRQARPGSYSWTAC
jgi:hypothetical protein